MSVLCVCGVAPVCPRNGQAGCLMKETVNRERCRKRRAASTMRCMGDLDHDGDHWAWSGDEMRTWSDSRASNVLADQPDWYEFLERP